MSIQKNSVDFKSSSSSSEPSPPSHPIQEEKQHVNITKTPLKTTTTPASVAANKDEKEEYEVVSYSSFDELGLSDDVLRGVYAYGFEKPSNLQQKALKPILDGKDVVVLSPSGTGKTASFMLGCISRIDCRRSPATCQGLILAPTRELATQIAYITENIGTYAKLRAMHCIGGVHIRDTINSLQNGNHLVVGTPGRVNDMMERKMLPSDDLKIFVLDEVDEMLSRGFRDQIYEICCRLPKETQIILASVTMPDDVVEMTEKFMRNPVKILYEEPEVTLYGIRQFYINVERESWKLDTLCDLYETLPIPQSVIFCNTSRKAMHLDEKLRERSFVPSVIHCDCTQSEREEVLKGFRDGRSRILICTDLLARGIDVHVPLILNYDLPRNFDSYLKRVGKTGRFGRHMFVAISLVTEEDMPQFRALEQFFAIKIDELLEEGSLANLF